MKQWYQTLFENYANTYEKEPFTRGTIGEGDFIEKEMGYNKSLHVLDIGCGTGRHLIELVKRGYRRCSNNRGFLKCWSSQKNKNSIFLTMFLT